MIIKVKKKIGKVEIKGEPMVDIKINIPSYKEEANYRYQMPKMQLEIQGRGGNIRTTILNMVDVAKALNVNTDCKREQDSSILGEPATSPLLAAPPDELREKREGGEDPCFEEEHSTTALPPSGATLPQSRQ